MPVTTAIVYVAVMYAVRRGLPESLALDLIHLTLIVVTLSILVHGLSVKPLMLRLRRNTVAT